MLKTVDFPIIIPSRNRPHSSLIGREWNSCPASRSQGWCKVVAATCAQLGLNLR